MIVFKRLSQYGLEHASSFAEKRKVFALNLLALTSSITAGVFILINTFYYQKYSLAITELGLFLFLFWIIFLQKKGRLKLARLLITIVMQLFFASLVLHFSLGRMAEYLLFLMIILYLLFYSEKKVIIFMMSLVNILLFYFPQFYYNVYPAENYSWTNPVVMFISLTLLIFYMFEGWRKTEYVVNEKNRLLNDYNKKQEELMRFVAHDLKSPFNKILGLNDLMSRNVSSENKELNNMIKSIALDSRKLIDNIVLLDLSDQNGVSTNFTKVNLTKLIGEKIQEFKSLASEKNIAIKDNLLEHQIDIVSDYSMISRILENLISNAIKFSEKGKHIEVYLEQNSEAKIRIKDYGQGFTPEDKEKLFTKYLRLSAQPTAGESSSGLGLAIVKNMLKGINGKIELKSEAGKGAEFIITLPSH